MLTDYTYYATAYDVVVAEAVRGEGYGRQLMAGVLEHQDLQSVDGLALSCRAGLVAFYESVGFERFEREVDEPEGGIEELVRMTDERE